jgi:hypothetical protein
VLANLAWVPLEIRSTACIDDMDQCTGLPEVIEELVAETLSCVSVWHEPSNIKQFYGNKSGTIIAWSVARVTRSIQLHMGAFSFDIGHSFVGFDCGERITGDFCRGQGSCREEG